jgi:hypothetical protein
LLTAHTKKRMMLVTLSVSQSLSLITTKGKLTE